MTGKAHLEDIEGRIRDIRADPSNQRIVRVPQAGEIIDGHLVTHNGLLVKPVDPGYVRPLMGNRGCHEPQEELVFQEVLKHIPRGGTMVELGAYWAFYSMWFGKQVPDAKCYLVEPKRKNLKVGRYNFAKNGLQGEFIRGRIGHGYVGVDRFLASHKLDYIDMLHADIQGAEFEMLRDAEQSLRNARIGYIFIGTHSQSLHYQCKSFLERNDYVIVAHADFDYGTYCCDGVLVARQRNLAGLQPMEIPLRDAQGQQQAERRLQNLRPDDPQHPVRAPRRWVWRKLRRMVQLGKET